MTHREIYGWFRVYFELYDKHVDIWFPNGKHSIRVRQANGQEFIFTYNGKEDWRFETLDSFLKSIDKKGMK